MDSVLDSRDLFRSPVKNSRLRFIKVMVSLGDLNRVTPMWQHKVVQHLVRISVTNISDYHGATAPFPEGERGNPENAGFPRQLLLYHRAFSLNNFVDRIL